MQNEQPLEENENFHWPNIKKHIHMEKEICPKPPLLYNPNSILMLDRFLINSKVESSIPIDDETGKLTTMFQSLNLTVDSNFSSKHGLSTHEYKDRIQVWMDSTNAVQQDYELSIIDSFEQQERRKKLTQP